MLGKQAFSKFTKKKPVTDYPIQYFCWSRINVVNKIIYLIEYLQSSALSLEIPRTNLLMHSIKREVLSNSFTTHIISECFVG